MHNKGMVEGLLDYSFEFHFCENCIYRKQNHVSCWKYGLIGIDVNQGSADVAYDDEYGIVGQH